MLWAGFAFTIYSAHKYVNSVIAPAKPIIESILPNTNDTTRVDLFLIAKAAPIGINAPIMEINNCNILNDSFG